MLPADAKRGILCVLQSRYPIWDTGSEEEQFICLDSAYKSMLIFSGETGFPEMNKMRI
jgi:hypothetical protein